MELAVQYPADALGSNPAHLRGFTAAAEAAGYTRFVLPEHVLGADPDRPGGWTGAYTYRHEWPEPFTTFGYLAAVTTTLELMTGVLILPQRQTVLVAKQAAQIDVLSGGRLVLGVGTGWNAVEYHGLGQPFRPRARRIEEQVGLLRRLWKEPVLTFEGEFDHIDRAGLNPLPMKGDIPIWMGGSSPRTLERIGKMADGWFPLLLRPDVTAAGIEQIGAAATAAGRDPSKIGVMCMVTETGNLEKQVEMAKRYEGAGATHLVLATQSDLTLTRLEQHVDRLTRFAEALRAA